jgi:hypothetical protein
VYVSQLKKNLPNFSLLSHTDSLVLPNSQLQIALSILLSLNIEALSSTQFSIAAHPFTKPA